MYPVAPTAVPHAMLEDTIIDGYLYPKDAVIFMNTCELWPTGLDISQSLL
jgi:hypothetical protein